MTNKELLQQALNALQVAQECIKDIYVGEDRSIINNTIVAIRAHLDNTTTIGDKTYVQPGGYLMGGIMTRPWFRITPTGDKTTFLVEHNCNGNVSFQVTDNVDENTARLIELAILEGQRRRSREINNLLGDS